MQGSDKHLNFTLDLDSLRGLTHTCGCCSVVVKNELACPRREGGVVALEMENKPRRGLSPFLTSSQLGIQLPLVPAATLDGQRLGVFSGLAVTGQEGPASEEREIFVSPHQGWHGTCCPEAGVWLACAQPAACVCVQLCAHMCSSFG